MSYESPVSRGLGGGGIELEMVLFNTHEVMTSSFNGLLNNFDFLTYKF